MFCTGCGRRTDACGGCGRDADPWHYCPECGTWLATQVTPTGWTARCRGCGLSHEVRH
jgi:hypothetical protein